MSNQEVREVKDRTSGCERRDFSRSCRVFFYAGLKGHKEMSKSRLNGYASLPRICSAGKWPAT
ncbi:hypothetical protein, partial [Parabacteroides merdae]|uniref:hypothetical protein n=1 Tax=Parabacteroides merdae TaxID=46503 RepID=UPI00232AE456